jgi:hypothetical protein
MSEQMNEILEMTSGPKEVTNPWNDSMVLSRPTQSKRVWRTSTSPSAAIRDSPPRLRRINLPPI